MDSHYQYVENSRKRPAMENWPEQENCKRFFAEEPKPLIQENMAHFPMVPQNQYPYDQMRWPIGGFPQWNEQNCYQQNIPQFYGEDQRMYFSNQAYPSYYTGAGPNVNHMTLVSPSTSSPNNCKTPPLDLHNVSNGSFGALSDMSTPSVHNSSIEDEPVPVKQITPAREDDVVMIVGGRLAMVGNLTKYKLRVEEIRRRVSGPEFITCSTLLSIFRKAKKKNGSEEMRNLLKNQYGIELTACQRQGLQSTSFTPLLEGEAKFLAEDIDKFTSSLFPRESVARAIVQSLVRSGKTYEQALKMLNGFSSMMSRINKTVGYIKPKVSGEAEVLSNSEKLNHEYNTYSARTHGFGIINQNTWLREFSTLAESCKSVFLKTFSPESMPTFAPPPIQYQDFQNQFYPHFQGNYYNQPYYNS